MPAYHELLRNLLTEVGSEKQASQKRTNPKKPLQKRADSDTEPSLTDHPSKDVDDQTQNAEEGERSTENTEDVKETVPGGGVDSKPEEGTDQQDHQMDVGVTSTPTGDDPANEDNYQDSRPDPGTSSPVNMDVGEKYGSMNFAQLKKLSEKKANALLAAITVEAQKTAGNRPANKKAASQQTQQAQKPANQTTAQKAASAGYQLAQQAGTQQAAQTQEQDFTKYAAAAETMIRTALVNAMHTGEYLTELYKRAADDAPPPAPSDAPPADGGGSGGPGADLDPATLQAIQGGAGGDPSGGGMPPGVGDPGAAGGDPTGGAGGAGGGQGNEETINQLLMALMEMGVTPEQVIQALQGAQGGMPPGGGGMPPGGMPPDMAGGQPPPDAGGGAGGADAGGPPSPEEKQAMYQRYRANQETIYFLKQAKAYQRQGRFTMSAPKTAAQFELRKQIKKVVADILG